MKKCLIYIALLFALFFSHQYIVNASIDVNLCTASGTCAGNLNPSYFIYPNIDSSTFNYTVNGSTSNPDDGLRQGQRWRVMAVYCARYGNAWQIDYRSSVGVSINDYFISTDTSVTCQHTNQNGEVNVGNPVRIITDFTITTSGVFYMRYFVNRTAGNVRVGFSTYTILDGATIQGDENTQNIINNDNSNTQDIINNNNQNTQRIVDAQNQNTQAVNNLNNNMTSSNTSGSESFLTSIINDPAFQDNTGINGIIQLPLAMISSLSNQCQPIDVYIPFLNVNTQLPCISSLISQKMPAVANILRIAVNGFVLYRIFIDIVGLIKSARNPDEDRLDVLEL